jgi:NAD+ kinase
MKIRAVVNRSDERQDAYIRFLEKSFPEMMNEVEPDMYFVIGGDGAMLHAHKDFGSIQKPFFGKGLGTLNFIMNNFGSDFRIIEGLLNDTIKPTFIKTPKIEVHTKLQNGETFVYQAINDVIIGGDISDWNAFELTSKDGSFEDYQFNGTGICTSTPLGSSAFNMNNGGKLIPIDSNLWSMTNIVSNRKIDELMKPQKVKIKIESLRSSPTLFVDGVSITGLDNGDVVTLRKCVEKFEIAFLDPKEFFAKRMKLQQERR